MIHSSLDRGMLFILIAFQLAGSCAFLDLLGNVVSLSGIIYVSCKVIEKGD